MSSTKFTPLRSTLSIAALLLAASVAQAALIPIFNTGVDSASNVLPDGTIGDPHYTLAIVPIGSTTTILARRAAGGFPIPPYIGDNLLSDWIGPANDLQLNGPIGLYDYRTTFSLSGLDALSASLSGLWASDNEGVNILLNGVATGNTIPSATTTAFDSFHSFSIGPGGFIPGLNTLDFLVNNDGGPTALRVEVNGSADPLRVPEPTTLALVGIALAGFGWSRRKQ